MYDGVDASNDALFYFFYGGEVGVCGLVLFVFLFPFLYGFSVYSGEVGAFACVSIGFFVECVDDVLFFFECVCHVVFCANLVVFVE